MFFISEQTHQANADKLLYFMLIKYIKCILTNLIFNLNIGFEKVIIMPDCRTLGLPVSVMEWIFSAD